MKISVQLTQQELTNIVSLHVFGKSKDIDIEILQEEPVVTTLPTYSDWYTVPDNHSNPNCPIQLDPDQQIEVIYCDGSSSCGQACWGLGNWKRLGNGDRYEICKFRLVNPKDKWLTVPSNHLNENCPIELPDFSTLEIDVIFNTGITESYYCWSGKHIAKNTWSQAANARIVKFRVKADKE